MSGPKHRITLVGTRGQEIPLYMPAQNRSGVKLQEVPDFEFLTPKHSYQQVIGRPGGVWQGVSWGEEQLTLRCLVNGPAVRDTVRNLIGAVGMGDDVCRIVVRSVESGYRWVACRFAGMSQVEWWGVAANPIGAKFELMLSVPEPLWKSFPITRKYVTDTGFNDLWYELDSSIPVWPVVTITGKWDVLHMRLSDSDKPQVMPYRADGYRVNTDPSFRSITSAAGGKEIALKHAIPYWGKPPRVEYRNGRYESAVKIMTDKKINVEISYVKKVSTPW